MEHRPESFTPAADESSRFFTETAGSSRRHSPAGSLMRRRGAGKGLQLFLCILAAAVFLGTAGCSDSDSDDLVLTDATWIAFQDGDGPWQELEIDPETPSFTPEVSDPDGRYGLAFVVARAAGDAEEKGYVQTITLQTTTADLPEIDFSSLLGSGEIPAEVTVPGEFDFGTWSHLYAGDENESVWSEETAVMLDPSFVPYDLVAALHTDGKYYPSKLVMKSLPGDLVSGDVWEVTIDFDADPDVQNLSGPYPIDLGGTVMHYGEVYLRTANNTLASLGRDDQDSETSFEYTALSDLPEGGMYLLELSIDLSESSSLLYFEGFSEAGNPDLAQNMPDSFDGEFAADTSTGYLLPGMTWEAEYPSAIAYAGVFRGTGGGIDYKATTLVTAGRQGAQSGLTMPDLRAAQGWHPLWSVPSDAVESYNSASVVLSSAAIQDFLLPSLTSLYLAYCPRLEDGDWIAAIANYRQAAGDPL